MLILLFHKNNDSTLKISHNISIKVIKLDSIEKFIKLPSIDDRNLYNVSYIGLVTAPSVAERTCEAYLASTPFV